MGGVGIFVSAVRGEQKFLIGVLGVNERGVGRHDELVTGRLLQEDRKEEPLPVHMQADFGLVDYADYDKDDNGVFEKRMYDDNGDGWLDRTVWHRDK